MPGYVIHLAVASRIIENRSISDERYINDFVLGNIIPDAMDRSNKKESHFWDDITYSNLNRIPNVENFLVKYHMELNNPLVLGYYTHLLLDKLFVKEYWGEHFQLLDKDKEDETSYSKVEFIRLIDDKKEYTREEFFSDQLYYGDYDRIYPYILEEYPFWRLNASHISEALSRLPIKEIDIEQVKPVLVDMVNKINSIYDKKDDLPREQLKIFDLDHIFTLMDKVVSNVCGII